MYLMKTLNTDRLSINLTLKRSEEKKLRSLIDDFTNYFDYIFVDFPPSSSRLTEILLDISEKTVKNHVSNIFKKIGVSDRTQAAVYAIKHNLVDIYDN